MSEVFPGIHRLKIPLPDRSLLLGYVNVYLVAGEDGYLLVDTGWNSDEALRSLQSQMAGLGLSLGDITQVASTHSHYDHYGLGGRIREATGAPLMLHRLESRLFDNGLDPLAVIEDDLRWLQSNGVPEDIIVEFRKSSLSFVEFMKLPRPDIILQGGETVSTGRFSFEVVWTPGHAPGHICFYEPDKKILLSGDHILPTITPHIGINQNSVNPLGDYLDSLGKVRRLDTSLVLPAHGDPFPGLERRVNEIAHHHELRIAEVAAAMGGGPKTAYEIATRITWLLDFGGVEFEKLSSLDKRLAVWETITHLELMLAEGRVKRFSRDGMVYYSTS